MKKILITYTALVTFILTSLLGAIILPLENQHINAATRFINPLGIQPKGANISIYYCRMNRSELDAEDLKVCNELIPGYLGYDKWHPDYQMKIGKSVDLQYALQNPNDTTCSVVQWDVYSQAFVQYSADADNYCHYEEGNNHCSFDGDKGPFDSINLNRLKQQFEEKCSTPNPTVTPTIIPSITPTTKPTTTPITLPSSTPTTKPSTTPTTMPSSTPTVRPSATPTTKPSSTPTVKPSVTPSITPILTPTISPSVIPTIIPSATPTVSATLTVTPTMTVTITPTTTATPVLTPTPIVLGDNTVFGFNLSKSVVGKLNYLVGELVTFNVTFENTGTEPITRINIRDVYTTDMRVSKIYLIQAGQKKDVTSMMITNSEDIDDGMILPSAPNMKSNFLNLTDLTGILKTHDKVTFEFVFKATGKNEEVCNQAFVSANFRREISSQKVCINVDTIIPVTD